MRRDLLLQWADAHVRAAHLPPATEARARRALDAYFSRRRPTFRLPSSVRGTAFECDVWRALLRIPSGQTITYGELARRIGHPRAARAVGTALKKNPLPVLVPCHRVVPAIGGIGQYGGGTPRKRWLLQFERTGR